MSEDIDSNESQEPIVPKKSKGGTAKRARRILGYVLGIGCLIPVMCIVTIGLLAVFGVFSGSAGDDDEAPAWSPDGRRIAFMSNRGGNPDIYTMNPDGSDVEQLTKNPFAMLWWLIMIDRSFDGCPDWSPDGEHIVFFSGRNNPFMASVEQNIIIMDRDGTNAKDLSLDSGNSEDFPSWSPAGDRIAFHSYRGSEKYDIYVRFADGTGLKRLTSDPSNDVQAAWSPDGSQIAFASDRDGDYEINIMDADGSNIVQLTDNPVDDSQPYWSPDNRQIAFMSDRDGDFDIYIMDVDGTNVVQLTGK